MVDCGPMLTCLASVRQNVRCVCRQKGRWDRGWAGPREKREKDGSVLRREVDLCWAAYNFSLGWVSV